MSLKAKPFLFLDCQTTGMRPSTGRLLELAWGVASAVDEKVAVQSRLIALPPGEELPARVSEITGIGTDEMREAQAELEVFAAFEAGRRGAEAALIHYAQFEKPFLQDLYARLGGASGLPFPVFCTQSLAKRLFPQLPSANIRGAAGFFGHPVETLKRAGAHVEATHAVWRGLVAKLEEAGVSDLAAFLDAKPAQAARHREKRYEYRMDRVKRLDLPDEPGVYRMLSKAGEILYVGKATSLKSRVNSYFRGVSGRDKRKLEMLAQVWDLDVTRCRTALEAALLEADEIKRHDPPYNVTFKRGRRGLVFYARDFSSGGARQSAEHPLGPFRPNSSLEQLRALAGGRLAGIFWEPIDVEDTRAGLELFAARSGLRARDARAMLAHGLNLFRRYVEPEDEAAEETAEPAEDRPYTVEEIADKFERLFRRAGREYHGARELTRLLDARVTLRLDDETRVLEFGAGVPGGSPRPRAERPWENLDLDTYDRMSVLRSELAKYEHTVESHFKD